MRSAKDITIEELKKVAAYAMAQYNVNRVLELLTEQEIISVCHGPNPDVFSDMNIVDNDTVRTYFIWERLRPHRLCRIMARLMDNGRNEVLDGIDFSRIKVKLKDIKPLLIRDPSIILKFKKDLSKISDNDAAFLLEMGKEYFLSNISIKRRRFTEIQQYAICKAYDYRRAVISLFDHRKFDGFHVSEILKKTHRENVDLLPIENMKIIDWIHLLKHSPDLYDLCAPLRFKDEPILFLIELASIVDDQAIYDMILKRDLDEVTPFGWERLLKERPDMFSSLCDPRKYVPKDQNGSM